MNGAPAYEIIGLEFANDKRSEKLCDLLSVRLRSGKVEIPPLPRVAMELNLLAQGPDPDIDRAIELVSRDPQIAGRVLHVGSSAVFGGKAATDLTMAVVRLGMLGLRDVVAAIVMSQLFRCEVLEKDMAEANRHAFAVGHGTAVVCRLLSLEGDTGFLAGLMHDVGSNLILHLLSELSREDPRWSQPDVVQRCVDVLHLQAGVVVCTKWRLDDAVCEAVRHHDSPELAANAISLVRAVALVDAADTCGAADEETLAEFLQHRAETQVLGLNDSQNADLARELTEIKKDPIIARFTA